MFSANGKNFFHSHRDWSSEMNSDDLVLVIENNSSPYNLTVILKQAGYLVLSADSFETALDIIRTRKPVLLICNDALDRSNSVKICIEICSVPEINLPPVCLAGRETVYANQVHLRLETCASEYIETPVEPLKFIKTITSLIEGRRTEDSLEQKDVIFRSLIENITDIITIISPDGFILYESPSVERILGRKPIDASDANAFDFVHPDDRQKVVDYICNSDQDAVAKGVEYRIRHEDGSWRTLHSVGRFNKSIFKTKTIVFTSRDVTERKLLTERLQVALEKSRMVWWEWNILKNEIITSNNFVEIYGSPKFNDPYIGFKLIHPADEKAHRTRVETVAGAGGTYHSEYRVSRQDNGNTVWIEETATAIFNDKNEIERLVGISFDVSERKESEESLLKSEEHLGQSQRLESIGRLAGGIAHDFNNMLTAINGYSELILRELKEDGSIRQKVLEIKKAGERSAALTQQLLAFSRRQILKPQRLDLNHVISDMSVLLRRLIGEHIGLYIELDENECRVEADPGQLSQVIMNLAVNARDAMPKGGNLKIKTENVYLDEKYAAKHIPTVPGNYVLLSVKDTGIGVDDETIEHLFEPFYTTKEKGSGTGLGLATVYGIVKQSGGYIWVESEPDKGASFDIYLPQVKGQLKISSEKIKVETDLTGSETILLVEDEEAVRELTVKILEIYGYTVIYANDGVEAFEIFNKSQKKISLLITDIVMPRMSGRDLAEKIKTLNPEISVLYSSGYSDDRNMMNGAAEKRIDFINKPFTPEDLARKVRQLLDRKK